jgi:hypothetical protein
MLKLRHTTPVVALLAAACSGEGNTGHQGIDAALVEAVPWTNGAVPVVDAAGKPVRASMPTFPVVGPGTADPGSRPIDCGELAGIELAPWVEDFEPTQNLETPGLMVDAPTWGVAEAWSSYDDGSFGAFRVPGDASWYPGLFDVRQYGELWGMPADRIAGGPSCNGLANDFALHFKGGRFNWYGAGAAHPLATGIQARKVCPPTPSADAPRADLCPPLGLEADAYWDLSLYDGLVFWARRGPDSTGSLLVGLQNIYTSDDLARGNQTYCKRIKECQPTCQNGLPCEPDDMMVNRCKPAGAVTTMLEPALVEELYPRCGASACSSPSYYSDPDFDGSECKPYEFSGMESNYYCYGVEPPPEAHERCGDGFVTSILLSTDWQLFKLPFDEFRQVGFGKVAPAFDLTTVSTIFVQVTVGSADVYVDNVSFYRDAR